LNILIISQYFWPENFRINDLATDLVEKGHKVTVLTGLPNYPKGNFFKGYGIFKKNYKEKYKGVDIYRVPIISRGNGKFQRLLLNYFSFAFTGSIFALLLYKKKFDKIFVFEVSPITVGIPAIVFKKLRNIPIVFWVLDLWPESVASVGAVKSQKYIGDIKILVKYIYSKCDKILVSSKGFKKSIENIEPRKNIISYFPNFIEKVDRGKVFYPELSQKINFPEGFKIMYAGNIGYAQSFPTILEAAEILRDYEIYWIIVGDGRFRAWVKERIKQLGLEKKVLLPGSFPQDTMPFFYSKSDVMLVSLKNELNFSLTVPGKVQSYMAFGKPIVAALDGEGANMIEDSCSGITCRPENPKELAETVLQMYNLPKEQLIKMGKSGKKYCEKHFNRDLLVDELINIFKQL
jgi:glycosyltransferase involved in cell wall biosynthesis